MNALVSDPLDLLRSGYDAYLVRFRSAALEPADPFLPFDFTRFMQRQWHLLGGMLIRSELQDLTNILNDWQQRLLKWHVWNSVLLAYDEQDAWALRKEFLEADAHLCLLSPSALRDKLTLVATHGIHQARLACEPQYKDHLQGDPQKPCESAKQYPRHERERRLEALLSPWSKGQQFMARLRDLDDDAYRTATLDYRNEHSHAIGPYLEIGVTQFVRRSVQQASQLVTGQGGRAHRRLLANAMSVSYGFGGRPPLASEAARVTNLAQFRIARECFEAYVAILDIVREQLPHTDAKGS